MRSRHADEFNHDPWAADYDEKVRDESNPIRTGYADLLRWTVEKACIGPASVVLDLGSGTGNTSALIPAASRVICVDVSARMAERAPLKLGHLDTVEMVEADLLEVFERDLPPLDAVVSTYSVHHLTEEEKPLLFRAVHEALVPGGRAAFGDLMFEHEDARAALADVWTDEERLQVLRSLDEEFPWRVDRAVAALRDVGFVRIETKRFSALSWGVAAEKPDRP